MFTNCTPEQAGISSKYVTKFIKYLESKNLAIHGLVLARGDKIFSETYWAPFDKDFNHRMYSQTKSYVAVAIGLLEEEGKINLDDPIANYFKDLQPENQHPYMLSQTIRQNLTMTTCNRAKYWFSSQNPSREHLYFNETSVICPAGTMWDYDSAGSQLLGALVERVSGKSLFDYLNEKVFKHLGTFKNATILKTRDGVSWGDSALVCTPRDMLSFAKFVMNYGTWEGKRLMNEEYLKTATSKVVDNSEEGLDPTVSAGYGYQIWRHNMNGFYFNGMGMQLAICVPDKDFICVVTADVQGYGSGKTLFMTGLEQFIVNNLGNQLDKDKDALDELNKVSSTRKLMVCRGEKTTSKKEFFDGTVYQCNENRLGIKNFSFNLEGDAIVWNYENAQGKKSIKFGLGYNEFDKFPQLGYSNDNGGVKTTDGFMYNGAYSAGFLQDNKLCVYAQIIDRYFGNFIGFFTFKDDACFVSMTKAAEDFLGEYSGEILAFRKK